MQRADAMDGMPAAAPRLVAWSWLRSLAALLRQEQTRASRVTYTRPLVAYVLAVAAVAAAVAMLTVHTPADPLGVALLTVAIAVMAASGVKSVSGVDTIFSASSFLHLGLSLSAGPVGALCGALGENASVYLRYRNGAFRSLFNLALIFLTNCATWFAFTEALRLPVRGPLGLSVAGLCAGLVHPLVNFGILNGVLAISTRTSYLQQWRQSLRLSPFNGLFYGYAAAGFVPLHDRFGPLGFTFALAPVVALQVFLIVLARRTRLHEEQRSLLLERLREEGVRVERSYDATLVALTHALDARDKETEGHSRRVVEYTRMVAVRLGIDGEELKLLCHGALLHDIGKIGVPDAILHKPAALTEAEWQVMRRHPEIGAMMVEEVEYLTEARRIILHHHERWDGRGYPLGLRGTQISLGARAFAVADTVDAITQDRPYRRGRSFDQAREELVANRGTQFDPDVVDAFLSLGEEELRRIAAIRARVGLDLLAGDAASSHVVRVFAKASAA